MFARSAALPEQPWTLSMSNYSMHKVAAADWVIPALYAGAALAVGLTFPRLEARIFPGMSSEVSAGAAVAFYSAIASGMITLRVSCSLSPLSWCSLVRPPIHHASFCG